MTRKRKRTLVVAAGCVAIVVAVSAVSAFAGGAFRGSSHIAAATRNAPQAQFSDACGTTNTRLALSTTTGADVYVGQAQTPGSYCVIYQDGNGTTVRTSGMLGGTPAGQALVLKALDTVANKYMLVVAVPDGFTAAAVGGATLPITNNILVLDASRAPTSLQISGAAGTENVNLSEFVQ